MGDFGFEGLDGLGEFRQFTLGQIAETGRLLFRTGVWWRGGGGLAIFSSGSLSSIFALLDPIGKAARRELNAAIAENKRIEKLQKQIDALEKKVMAERQPRKKWKIAEEIERLKKELGGTEND